MLFCLKNKAKEKKASTTPAACTVCSVRAISAPRTATKSNDDDDNISNNNESDNSSGNRQRRRRHVDGPGANDNGRNLISANWRRTICIKCQLFIMAGLHRSRLRDVLVLEPRYSNDDGVGFCGRTLSRKTIYSYTKSLCFRAQGSEKTQAFSTNQRYKRIPAKYLWSSCKN